MANYTEDGVCKQLKKDLISIILLREKLIKIILGGWTKFVS